MTLRQANMETGGAIFRHAAHACVVSSHVHPPDFPLVVLGGSAGALEPILDVLRGLDGENGAAVFVVLHIPAQGGRALVNVLERATCCPVAYAVAGERILPGRVYVAPPDQHLSIDGGQVRVHRGPHENHCRPAIDPLFRSAAHHHGRRVLAVLLSGALDDGTAGLLAVKKGGGLTVVQAPAEALHPSMPESAIANVAIDQVLRVKDIAPFVRAMVAEQLAGADSPRGAQVTGEPAPPGELSHRPSVHEMPPGQPWADLRSLRKRVALTRRMAERATATGRVHSAAILAQRIAVLEAHVRSLAELLDRASAPHEVAET